MAYRRPPRGWATASQYGKLQTPRRSRVRVWMHYLDGRFPPGAVSFGKQVQKVPGGGTVTRQVLLVRVETEWPTGPWGGFKGFLPHKYRGDDYFTHISPHPGEF